MVSLVSADLQRARAIRDQLTERLRDQPVVNGIGIARRPDGWAVKVNLVRPAPQLRLPSQIDGVEIQTEVVGPIIAR